MSCTFGKTKDETNRRTKMKKRLAIITVVAATALSAVGSASAALWDQGFSGPTHGAPPNSGCAADTACRAPGS
jgi:hypothetical protein